MSATLARLASEGARAFYGGPIAADIVRSVEGAGGLLELGDLECVSADASPALCTSVRQFSIATQPPISQGVVLLRSFRLLADCRWYNARDVTTLADRRRGGAHRLFGAPADTRRCGRRARGRAERMLAGELPKTSFRPITANAASETTTIAVVDNSGNAASLILSIFADFGSGVVTEETGILLNNRLSAFFLDPAHPNSISPRKRTIHTLHSVMVSDANGLLMAGGSPGGDNQPQVNLQVLARILLRGDDLGEAVAAPRWALVPGTAPLELAETPEPFILCEPGLDRSTVEAFDRTGWQTRAMSTPDIGSAKWVKRSADGRTVEAISDTRRQGAGFISCRGSRMSDPLSQLEVVQREIDRVFGPGYDGASRCRHGRRAIGRQRLGGNPSRRRARDGRGLRKKSFLLGTRVALGMAGRFPSQPYPGRHPFGRRPASNARSGRYGLYGNHAGRIYKQALKYFRRSLIENMRNIASSK